MEHRLDHYLDEPSEPEVDPFARLRKAREDMIPDNPMIANRKSRREAGHTLMSWLDETASWVGDGEKYCACGNPLTAHDLDTGTDICEECR